MFKKHFKWDPILGKKGTKMYPRRPSWVQWIRYSHQQILHSPAVFWMTKWHFFGNLSTSDNTAQQPSSIRSMSNALKLHGGMYETGIFYWMYSFQSIFPDRVSQIWPDTHSGIKTLGEHFSLKGCKWVGWSQAWKCKCLNLTFNENCLRNTSVLTQCTYLDSKKV